MSSDISLIEPDFIHLRCHSAYSLLEGAIHAKSLVKLAVKHKMPALAITDSANMFGVLDFSSAASAAGIQPIIGIIINVKPFITCEKQGAGMAKRSASHLIEPDKLLLLAQNNRGYKNLMKLTSRSYMKSEGLEKPAVTMDWLKEFNEGIICLTGGVSGAIGRLLQENREDLAAETLIELKKIFPNRLYIELMRHGMPEERATEDGFISLAYEYDVPIVATNDIMFNRADFYDAHDALMCIGEGKYVVDGDRRRVTPEHRFKSAKEMKALFADLPEAIDNSVIIAKRCAFLVEGHAPILPPATDGGIDAEIAELLRLTEEGLKRRLEKTVYKEDMTAEEKEKAAKPYFDRMDVELGIINEMGFPGYFLIVADFIYWCNDNGVSVGPGRGSGAGSIVAWALTITGLDPIKLGLLFERFLNPERVSMPDFDIDFCKNRRDEVIGYVRDKYGAEKVAQIITFGSLQSRMVVRDVGRVLQMPYGQIDKIAKMIPANPANPVSVEEAVEGDSALREMIRTDDSVSRLIELSKKLEGLYRNAGTHAAGVVIGDRPIDELTPVYRDPRSDTPVTQFNMKAAEKAGLVKFDFLGLKTLTVLQTAVDFVKESQGKIIDLELIDIEDKKTFDDICTGETIGIFQLESAGMRALMRQAKPRCFEDIIALISLYRPGPMDNIPEYCARRDGTSEVEYMHPLLEPILEETSGIMVYQEQVMQAAQVLAGYTLGGADLLRRAMGKKIESEMVEQRKIFMEGAKKHHDISEELSSDIFDQIAKFAGYGFNKSHAAAYALVSYQTAWMKTHYPVEFIAASMALDLDDTDKLSIFKRELERLKIPLLSPDVNQSKANFSVEPYGDEGKLAVRFALSGIKGVGEAAMELLVEEREENGLYQDVFDIASRLDQKTINKRQLENLASSGAFDMLNPNRAQVFESVPILTKYCSMANEEKNSAQHSLFGGEGEDTALAKPDLPQPEEWPMLEKLKHEFKAYGYYMSAHPLDSFRTALSRLRVVPVAEIPKYMARGGEAGHKRMAGIVLSKNEKRSAKGNKFAWVQLSDASGTYEALILGAELLESARDLLEAGTAVLINVEVEKRDEEFSYLIQRVESLEDAAARAAKILEVVLGNGDAAEKLAKTLDEVPKGRHEITLFMNLNGVEEVSLKLSQKWSLDGKLRNAIQAIPGVLEVREV